MQATAAMLLCTLSLGGGLLCGPAAANDAAVAKLAEAVCESEPTRPSCEFLARSRTSDEDSPFDGFRTLQNVARGTAGGVAVGTVLGLVSCVPVLLIAPAYAACAASMTIGLTSGAIVGGVAGGIANSPSHGVAGRAHQAEQDGPAANTGKGATDTATFAETLLRIAQEPENTAIAVAIDPGRWAWGAASSAATEDQAMMLALYQCQVDAGLKGVAGPCALYSVNARPIFVEAK